MLGDKLDILTFFDDKIEFSYLLSSKLHIHEFEKVSKCNNNNNKFLVVYLHNTRTIHRNRLIS